MRPLAALALGLAVLSPSLARAADVKTHELPSGKTYLAYRPKTLPEKPLLVLWLSHKSGADEAAAAWKEKCSAIPVLAVFPQQDKRGWRVYDWESQKVVKDRELAYLLEVVADAEKEYDIEKRHTIVAGDASGGDYAFELALRYPEKFAGSVPIVPTWCATNKFESNAKQVRIYFLVGEKDVRKKQAQDAHDRLRKSWNPPDMIWRPVEGLGHEMPDVAELQRALRWQQELASAPTEASLDWATKEWETGCNSVGIHLLGKLAKDKKLGERARKLHAAIEKQARKELDEALKQPKYSQMEELWRLHDRYACLEKIYGEVRKALADVGADLGVAEKPPSDQPPPAEPGSDEATQKILGVAARAQAEKKAGEHAKAIASLKEMVKLTDQAELGAGEKKQLYLVAQYELARCYALSGKKQQAIEALGEALDLGYDDWKQIDSDKELEAIRNEQGFRDLSARRNK